ncbi:MAG: CHAT domain-containing protein [Proteobacteria bacterium]|nr:CHAT domain-containing protein [Pseudomonadota bacterium]
MASTSRCASVRSRLAAGLLGIGLALLPAIARAADAACPAAPGSLHLALKDQQAALAAASGDAARAAAAGRLGGTYLRLNRLDEAEPLLQQAAGAAADRPTRAAALMDLGRLQWARHQPQQADQAWAAAAALQPDDAALALAAELNRIRLVNEGQRLTRLQAAAPRAAALGSAAERARHLLNLAAQARALPGGTALAFEAYEQGRRQALAAADRHDQARLAAEADDGLSSLYEAQQRPEEALRLTERGIAQAARVQAHDLLLNLEARAGRLARALGRDDLALAAYRRAVEHIEAVRSDIPVQYLDGRSSFRQTLAPTYLGLTDLLLQRAAGTRGGTEQQALLRQARDTVELIKQTELEDYLRDRCGVAGAGGTRGGSGAAAYVPPPGTAIYYPIILSDRLELLLETDQGIERRSVAVEAETLRQQVLDYVAALRDGNPLRARSEALYRWLLAPIDELLARHRVETLVSVPDGVLRLLPLASLHDGRGYLLQRLAVATVPALSLTATPRPGRGPLQALLAGMSEPGPVVDKLPETVVDGLLEPGAPARQVRGAARSSALRQALALPGVKQEIESIAKVMPAEVLLDQGFTLAALKERLRTHRHPLVHIASHGVFGDSADSTFIMTYDELLTLDGLQALLRDERPGQPPIELLTLSACQTAEGDDRAPLGMSGTALKARARSALGTLWPVSDDAANRVMASFYRRLAAGSAQGGTKDPVSRVQALREAQLELLRTPNRQHPFYWAPFILIGDWS